MICQSSFNLLAFAEGHRFARGAPHSYKSANLFDIPEEILLEISRSEVDEGLMSIFSLSDSRLTFFWENQYQQKAG